MPKATGEGVYSVKLTARCEMTVHVEARSKADAERLVDELSFTYPDDDTVFEPVDWARVRAVRGSAKPLDRKAPRSPVVSPGGPESG